MKKRLFAVLLCVCFVCALLPIFSINAFANVTYVVIPNVGSAGANTSNTVSNYSPYWQYWSQGASKYQKMRDAGCRVVAQSKMLVELGAASGNSSYFNPDIYLEWAMPRGYWPTAPDNILEQHAVGTAAIAYAQENGIDLKREGYISLSGTNNANDVALVMQYINAGYYVIMHCSAHQAYIGRAASLSAGTPIILDSWYSHSYSQAACCQYSGYTSAYFSGFYYFSTSTPPAPATMDWTEEVCNPTETSAYISIKAVPSVSGSFGECGITIKDADTGTVVGSKTETADSTARTYLTIYYYVTEELGIVLTPGKTYTYQFYTYFNGTRYDSPIGSFTTPHTHSYITAITAPTCTQQGYTTHTCSICGDSYIDTYVSALGHNFVNGVCTRCGVDDPDYIPDAKLTIYGTDTTAVPGSTIRLPVMISGGEDFAGFTLTVSNSEGLTLRSIEKGALLKTAEGMFTANVAEKIVNWTSSTGIAGEGELLVLSFDVSTAAVDGSKLTINLSLKDNKPSNMADVNEKPIGVTFKEIAVTILTTVFGDVNSDGDVDTIDAIRLAKYLVDLVDLTDAQKKAADVNGDNDITTTDAIRLAKYLVGLVDPLRRQPNRAMTRTADEAKISVGSATVKGGETVSVPVTISGNPGFAGFTLTVNTAEGLSLKSIEKGALLADAEGMLTKNVTQKQVNWTSAENVTGDGELLLLTFEVSASAEDGAYAVSVELKDGKQSNFANAEEQPIVLSFTDGRITVSNHEHSYTSVVTLPTCTEQGFTTHTCVCGDSFVTDYVPALGHEWDEGKVTTPATTTTDGVRTYLCTRCGAMRTEVIPATGEDKPCDGGPICPSYKFTDVKAGDWYHLAVDFAVKESLFKGMTDTTFEPNTPMTRGMLVTVLWRYEGSPKAGASNFTDLTADWYQEAVAWAAENGIVNGVGNGKFDPDGKITREQMAAILYRYSQSKGYDASKRGDLNTFPDATKVSDWAKDAYGWAVGEGLITGNEGRLDPQGSATRAQVATILMRFIDGVKQPPSYDTQGHTYEFLRGMYSWTDAQKAAREKGGYLVRFDNEDEFGYVTGLLTKSGCQGVIFIIGARRAENSKDYYFVDADDKPASGILNAANSWTSAYWASGEPTYEWEGSQEWIVSLEYKTENAKWLFNDIVDNSTYPVDPNCHGIIIEYDAKR